MSKFIESMKHQMWKTIFESHGLDYHPILGGAPDDPPANDDSPADPPANPDPPADPPANPPANPEPPANPPATPPTDPKVAELTEKINEQSRLLNTLIEKTADGAKKEDVWTIDKLEDAEAKCHSGTYDMKYLPKITTMKALLVARQVASETTTDLTRQNTWADVQAKWNKGLVDAQAEFGDEVADPNSKLFKTAQAILHQDPGFQRYQELKSKGLKLSQIDPTLIDPSLQYKAVEIAASRLGIARKSAPPNPTPKGGGGSKNALGGNSLPSPDGGQSTLQKLEDRAIASGNPQDWINLNKEQIRQDRERRGTRV